MQYADTVNSIAQRYLKNIELSFQGIGSEKNYTKQILQIIGDLPEDVPMLTLEQVHEVFANLPEYRSSENGYQNVTKKLNAITGAPTMRAEAESDLKYTS